MRIQYYNNIPIIDNTGRGKVDNEAAGRHQKFLEREGRSKIKVQYFLSFFRQHWNKLPRRECSVGLYDHTVKIWKLHVCFSSCFSLVKVELSVNGAAKFEMCVSIHFLHAEGQPAIWNSIQLVTENSKWDAPFPFKYELGSTAFLASGTQK